MPAYMINGQTIEDPDLINLLEIDGNELVDICKKPGYLTGKRLGVVLSRFGKIEEAEAFLRNIDMYDRVGSLFITPSLCGYLDIFSMLPKSVWPHILKLPGSIGEKLRDAAIGHGSLYTELLQYPAHLRLDFFELPPIVDVLTLMVESGDDDLIPLLNELLEVKGLNRIFSFASRMKESQQKIFFQLEPIQNGVNQLLANIHITHWSAYKLAKILCMFKDTHYAFMAMHTLPYFKDVSTLMWKIAYEIAQNAEFNEEELRGNLILGYACDLFEDEIDVFTHGDDFADTQTLFDAFEFLPPSLWKKLMTLPGMEMHAEALKTFTKVLKNGADREERELMAKHPTEAELAFNIETDFRPEERWEGLMAGAKDLYIEFIANGGGDKLFNILEMLPSDPSLLKEAVDATREGYRRFDEKEGFSEVQYKQFHFFHPVCKNAPRPFLDKLEKTLLIVENMTNHVYLSK